ncbi:hypothetical protein [Halobacterium litoreum]|uniref:Lipoprotein n=1 Tax=Halobacterium litoreum TaxID=2039234 RepID=A0ABD5NF42_9EURY|nr:hypothetical protein [Halobacterium litoreum]UHH13653.1 hypothetical protein LT972_01340 [Halobacterium litoreum]
MRSNALHLAVAACLLLAGCSAAAPSTDQPTTPTDTTTQEPCRTIDYEPKPLPDPPANLTAERAASFTAAYENATVWNENAPEADHALRVSTEASVVNRTDTGFVVHVSGGGSYAACHGEAEAVADMFLHTNYFVNETTVVRLTHPENKTDDPRRHGGEVLTGSG